MGRRSRGRGTAQRMKERQLGGLVEGFSKPMLDAMNEESKRRFRLGIGVVVQEGERARQLLASLQGGWRPGRWGARRRARAELALWEGRLREVAEAVADRG